MASDRLSERLGFFRTVLHAVGLIVVATIFLGCASKSAGRPHQTLLLVSLEDGSVIQQTLQLEADICFKTNSESTTTCLTRGDPIVDARAGKVIGYQMNSSQIELVAR